jgi:hypothetical protein
LIWRRFANDSLKFMCAALFLASELFHFYMDAHVLGWTAKVGDFLKVLSDLQERCRPAA